MNNILLNKLKSISELIPDEHDGSYELMRETIRAYSHLEDLRSVDYNDLNTIYLMSVGTWKHGVVVKRKLIEKESHLKEEDKKHLVSVLEKIESNAKNGKYSNHEPGVSGIGTFGMFGTGFYSFKNKTDAQSTKGFIKLCIDILELEDDELIFAKAKAVLNSNYRGMKAASASMVLHCLKPYTFPILNSNMGSEDIFKELDITLNKKGNIETYIDNCIAIKEFRDKNLPFKNYRILDMQAWDIETTKKPIVNNINIEAIENYLQVYAGEKYISIENAGEDADKMLQISEEGKFARKQFIDIADKVGKSLDGYVVGTCNNWVNQAQKVTEYFWIEYKKKSFENIKSSISLFAWKIDDSVLIYLAVEARDTACSKEDFKRHNGFIYKEMNYPDLYYVIEDHNGKYKKIEETREDIIQRLENNEFKKIRLQLDIIKPYTNESIDEIIEQIIKGINKLEPYYDEIIKKREIELDSNKMNIDKNTILYGPPGTGKTYNTVNYAISIIENKHINDIQEEDYHSVYERYIKYKNEGRIVFTTFHQSYGYEEFIEGIKPKLEDNKFGIDEEFYKELSKESNTDLKYYLADGVFKKFCIDAQSKLSNMPHVFIIDEINRGNISKIFGELITLIEDKKRLGEAEEMTAKLPYSGDDFGVPNNVYILGTMNTADRSIALMDTALRRRFSFVEMMPESSVLMNIPEIEGINIIKMLDTINERIELLYDREHTIGHAYFTCLKDEPTIEKLGNVFKNSIVPLLQEYFYEDYSKIQLVLGDNAKEDKYKFILNTDVKLKSVFKGNLDIDVDYLPEKKYSIQNNAFNEPESYKQI